MRLSELEPHLRAINANLHEITGDKLFEIKESFCKRRLHLEGDTVCKPHRSGYNCTLTKVWKKFLHSKKLVEIQIVYESGKAGAEGTVREIVISADSLVKEVVPIIQQELRKNRLFRHAHIKVR